MGQDPFMLPIVQLVRVNARVANFSSPHRYFFDDGAVLSACSKKRSDLLAIEVLETTTRNPFCPKIIDAIPQRKLSSPICEELSRLYEQDKKESIFEILIVPSSILAAMIAERFLLDWKARCIRLARQDRKTVCPTVFSKG